MLKTTREVRCSSEKRNAHKTKAKHSKAHVFLRDLITMNKQIDRVLAGSLKLAR